MVQMCAAVLCCSDHCWHFTLVLAKELIEWAVQFEFFITLNISGFIYLFACFGAIKKQWIHSVIGVSGWEKQVGSLGYLIWPCRTLQRWGEWAQRWGEWDFLLWREVTKLHMHTLARLVLVLACQHTQRVAWNLWTNHR